MLVPEDEPSRKGKFRWVLACYNQNGTKIYVPYVYRTTSTHAKRGFVPVRFLDAIIDRYFNKVAHHLIGLELLIAVPSCFPTPDECILLNSINKQHCKNKFGSYKLGIEDGILIELADAVEILKFLSTSTNGQGGSLPAEFLSARGPGGPLRTGQWAWISAPVNYPMPQNFHVRMEEKMKSEKKNRKTQKVEKLDESP